MARRRLLTGEERQALLGIPPDADSLARLFTLSRLDRNLVAERRGDANRLGCAVQLALLRHPGTALAYLDQPTDALVTWMAGQLDIPAAVLAEYARRPQTLPASYCPAVIERIAIAGRARARERAADAAGSPTCRKQVRRALIWGGDRLLAGLPPVLVGAVDACG